MSIKNLEKFLFQLKNNSNLRNDFNIIKENYKNIPNNESNIFIEKEVIPFAAKHGMDFSLQELINYSLKDSTRLISDEELEGVTGGKINAILTTLLASTLFGIVSPPLTSCAAMGVDSPSTTQSSSTEEQQPQVVDILELDKDNQYLDFKPFETFDQSQVPNIINNKQDDNKFKGKFKEDLKIEFERAEKSLEEALKGYKDSLKNLKKSCEEAKILNISNDIADKLNIDDNLIPKKLFAFEVKGLELKIAFNDNKIFEFDFVSLDQIPINEKILEVSNFPEKNDKNTEIYKVFCKGYLNKCFENVNKFNIDEMKEILNELQKTNNDIAGKILKIPERKKVIEEKNKGLNKPMTEEQIRSKLHCEVEGNSNKTIQNKIAQSSNAEYRVENFKQSLKNANDFTKIDLSKIKDYLSVIGSFQIGQMNESIQDAYSKIKKSNWNLKTYKNQFGNEIEKKLSQQEKDRFNKLLERYCKKNKSISLQEKDEIKNDFENNLAKNILSLKVVNPDEQQNLQYMNLFRIQMGQKFYTETFTDPKYDYFEYDVKPFLPRDAIAKLYEANSSLLGKIFDNQAKSEIPDSRGDERFVIAKNKENGAIEKVYYTANHYKNFIQITE